MTLSKIKELFSHKYFYDEYLKTLIYTDSNFVEATSDNNGDVIIAENCRIIGVLDPVYNKGLLKTRGMTDKGSIIIAMKVKGENEYYINPDIYRLSQGEAEAKAKKMLADFTYSWFCKDIFDEQQNSTSK